MSAAVRNVALIARREYAERVRSRAFVFSTLLLAGLAVVVALIPLAVRLVDRASVTRVAVAADEAGLAATAAGTMDTFLNSRSGAAAAGGAKTFDFVVVETPDIARRMTADGEVSGAIVIGRKADGGLDFAVVTVGALGQDRQQLLQVGAFAVGILDWTASQPAATRPFVIPGFSVVDAGTPSAGGGGAVEDPATAADYASRRIVGIVFVVISFLTLVFYGMWVAAGVVAEKASRVMELLISAATAPQLVVGKVVGIGLAGLTQVSLVLVPALATMLASGQLGDAMLGQSSAPAATLSALSPGLLLAFVVYFVLGFALYAALYAGAGSMLSRAEDLQVVALPLSIPAIAGYMPAVLALSGSTSIVIRIASYIPFWSPFTMLARLSVGHVEPWELVLSIGLLAATVPLVTALSIRVYRGGVILYGQPPSVRTFLRVLRGS